jgi:hypothetical protein
VPLLYLLGGAARAGKSTIAHQFLREMGTPFFCLDYLMMGFTNGLPDSGVDPEDDELQVGKLLWPVVKAMATAMLENGENYLLEGVQLNPHHVYDLSRQFPAQVRACFVGYADLAVTEKLRQLREFSGGTNDWLSSYDDLQLSETILRLKALSAHIRSECAHYGLYYLETTTDLAQTVEQVVHYFKKGQS